MKFKLGLFLKSLKFSWELTRQSSGFSCVLYFFLVVLGASIGLSCNFVLKYLLDSIKPDNPFIITLIWTFVYIFTLVISYVISTGRDICFEKIIKKASHLYEIQVNRKLQDLSLSFIDSSSGRDMLDEVRYSKNTAVHCLYRVISIISLAYTFVVSFITISRFSIWYSILFVVITIPGILANELIDEKTEKLRIEKAPDVRKFSYYRWMLTDAWPAKDVRTYNLTDSIKKRYEEEKKKYINVNKLIGKKKMYILIGTDLVQILGTTVFMVFVITSAFEGGISIGEVTLLISMALAVSESFKTMLNTLVIGFERTTEIMNRVFSFFSIVSENYGNNNITHFESLEFQDVYFKYPNSDNYILKGVNFKIQKGERISLIGINGSGKSTIVKLIIGLYKINKGRILLNGKNIDDFDIEQLRGLFSVLFQEFVRYPLTLRENVALSKINEKNDTERVEKAMKLSGVYEELHLRNEYDLDKYMTRQFDDSGIELSTGQWQKIALARAFFKDAPVVIFDEPSAALDAEAEDRIFSNFEKISFGKTGIMITHRISAARRANHIIVLDNGQIVEEGIHSDLVNSNGLYSHLYSLQKEKYACEGDSNS